MKRALSKRSLTRLALVPAAATVFTMIPLAGSAFAAGCHDTGCENKGPVSMGCDADGHTVLVGEVYSDNGGRTDYELRWSNKCWAGWARTGDSKWAATISVEKWNPDRTKLITRRTVTIKNGQHDWTNMVGGKGYMVRACATEKSTGNTDCTRFVGTDS